MKTWETFLPIPITNIDDMAPAVDDAWLFAKGCYLTCPSVLRLLRDEVLPLIRTLEQNGLRFFSFLVHDGASGVPTPPEDPRLYLHLRVSFEEERADDEVLAKVLPAKWQMTQRTELGPMAGVDHSIISEEQAWAGLSMQCDWLLDLVEYHERSDVLPLLLHVRQFLHFFSNMAQMRVL